MNWKNELIWITGASSGIGLALAKELNSCGASVVRTARNEETLEKTHNEFMHPERDFIFPGDVTDALELEKIVSEVTENVGSISCVVANAGTYKPTDPVPFKLQEYEKITEVNYLGLLKTLAAIIPQFSEKKSGRIVGISSIVGIRAVPRAAAYGASKSATIYFLESIRFQLEKMGIQVQVVLPGFVKTPLTDKNEFDMPFIVTAETAASEIRKGIEKNVPQIHFPKKLTYISKFMSILPGSIYHYIMSKGIKV